MTDLDEPAPTLVARYYKDGKDCLIPHKDPNIPPRMLTPRECGLLQTFPPTFWIPEAKTPAYKQFGNAITVEVARVIARSLTSYLYA
jgi:DNA (cytosine-5)-methyltransferase 1